MKRSILSLILLIWVVISTISAQESSVAPLQIAYQDATGAVLIYHEADNTTTTLINASDIPADAQVSADFSPDGHYVAVMVKQVIDTYLFNPNDDGKTIGELGYKNRLYVYNLVTGDLLLGYDVLPAEFVIKPQERDAMLEAYFGVQWSPNSDGLLFVRGTAIPVDEYATNGYGYLVHFNILTQQLTDLPAMSDGTPYDLHWSQNGQYAVYRSIDHFGTGAGISARGVYVVDMTDITAIRQHEMLGCCEDIVPLGWLNSGEFVYSHFSILAGAAGLFVYNPQTDSTTTLLPEGQNNLDYNGIDIDPTTGAMVVSVYDFPANEVVLEAGVYVYDTPQTTTPTKISDAIGAQVLFGGTGRIYIGGEAPAIYDLPTRQFIPNISISAYVYLADFDAYFTEGDAGARLYVVNPDGSGQIYEDIMPKAMLSSVRFVNAPSGMYFIGFVPHHYQGQMGSDSVVIGAIADASTSRSVSIGAGNFTLDAVIDLSR